MKNLTIARPTPFKKPDISPISNHFRADILLLKNHQQKTFLIKDITKTNFMIL